MLTSVLLYLLFSFSLLVYNKIKPKNSFHLKYLLGTIIFNFITLALFILLTELKIKSFYYALMLSHHLSVVCFYLHIEALLLGYKKKIHAIHYFFLLLLFLFSVLDVFKIHFLFNSSNNLLSSIFNNNISPNFIDLVGIKQIIIFCYLLLTLRMVRQNINTAALIKNKKSYKRWIYLYLLISLLLVFNTIVGFYNPLNFHSINSEISIKILKGLSILLALNYYLNPILLETVLKAKETPKTAFSENDFERLTGFFKNTKTYLNPKTSLESISNGIGLTKTQIRDCIQFQRNQNFNEFVNTYRIDYALSLLENGKYLRNHTIESVALKCGFNSPQSFYQNFKKIKKVTPSVYLKNNMKTL